MSLRKRALFIVALITLSVGGLFSLRSGEAPKSERNHIDRPNTIANAQPETEPVTLPNHRDAQPVRKMDRSLEPPPLDLQKKVVSKEERERMREYIANRYDPEDVFESFTDSLGQTIDCVDIYGQPALKRPGMENHRIEMSPGGMPIRPASDPPPRGHIYDPDERFVGEVATVEPSAVEARSCPQGSIPILRFELEDLERFETLDDFLHKVPGGMASINAPMAPQARAEHAPQLGPKEHHQYAHAFQWVANRGASAHLNRWNPFVHRSNEFSLSQIWVARGSGADRETVEVGWQVAPRKYGDRHARLFIYFTPDNYKKGGGGCYNLDCSAFVQTSNHVTIGGSLGPPSVYGGTQYETRVMWFKNGAAGDWWLYVGNQWVGFYPRALFDSKGLSDQGELVDFGGEIIDQEQTTILKVSRFITNMEEPAHTGTDMGNGMFPSAGWGRAAYQRALLYIDTTNTYRNPTLTAQRDDHHCYDIQLRTSLTTWWRQYFYFGGTGHSSACE